MYTLIGQHIESPDVQSFFDSMASEPLSEQFEDEVYYEFPEKGVAVIADNATGLVKTLQFFSGEKDDFQVFSGDLPAGLRFDMSRSEVRESLGVPERSGEEAFIEGLGQTLPWDRFLWNDVLLHVEYTEGQGSIGLLSLMEKGLIP